MTHDPPNDAPPSVTTVTRFAAELAEKQARSDADRQTAQARSPEDLTRARAEQDRIARAKDVRRLMVEVGGHLMITMRLVRRLVWLRGIREDPLLLDEYLAESVRLEDDDLFAEVERAFPARVPVLDSEGRPLRGRDGLPVERETKVVRMVPDTVTRLAGLVRRFAKRAGLPAKRLAGGECYTPEDYQAISYAVALAIRGLFPRTGEEPTEIQARAVAISRADPLRSEGGWPSGWRESYEAVIEHERRTRQQHAAKREPEQTG